MHDLDSNGLDGRLGAGGRRHREGGQSVLWKVLLAITIDNNNDDDDDDDFYFILFLLLLY